MDYQVNILVVEDNVLIADDMQTMLEEMGYAVGANVTSHDHAVTALKKQRFDIALLDIQLASDKTGIDLAKHIRAHYNMPIIFVTSNSDQETINEAKDVKPNGYLVKPFGKQDLYSTIEITLSNFKGSDETNGSKSNVAKNAIFIKKDHLFHKILFKHILYVKADNVYVEIVTKEKTHVLRSTLKDFLFRLPSGRFFRTSKSYIVNIDHIQAINSRDVIINDHMIPISKEFKSGIKEALNL